VTAFCKQCGARLDRDAAFCGRCGAALTMTAPATPSSNPASRRTATTCSTRPARSKAWMYYTLLALCGFIYLCAGHPVGIVATVACAAYAAYLYRGGRFVIWFW
jgi:hypothetical protein